jgi:glycogen debranching enzyme
MASPWQPSLAAASLTRTSGDVSLVEGPTFCISNPSGDILPGLPQGLFVLDTRVVSQWELRIDGKPLEPLAVDAGAPFSATFVARSGHRGTGEPDLVVLRHRDIGSGLRERIEVVHHGLASATVALELACTADFAGIFTVKEGRETAGGRYSHEHDDRSIHLGHMTERGTIDATIRFSEPAEARPGGATWNPTLAPGERWELCVEVQVAQDGTAVEPLFRCGQADAPAVPEERLASWRARLPLVNTNSRRLAGTVARSSEDLGALRIFDPDHPDTPVVAAGAPWFMTLFGRDSLLTSWMTLPADPSLTCGVLETLARMQGTEVNRDSEEEPGKILHEVRTGGADRSAFGGPTVYYGSIDATPLFVMLLGEARRWGLPDPLVERMLPHADRALEWIEQFGDLDGDGYVEYARQSDHGLDNQGWKDSWDAVRWADGRLATPPIALCEVQGYTYAAYLARAHFAEEAGDTATFERYRAKAVDLRRRFNEDFWLEEQGTFALGLDRDKRPIDAVTSNPGHCLWTGIADPERAAAVADRLLGPDLFTGWGIRTLGTGMAAYNPVSYHNGSVWPHDNALCAAGLMRYGFVDHAHRVIEGQLAVAAAQQQRLPELFAGFARDEVGVPAAYPASCSPQAWAAGAPLLWLRTMARLDPNVPGGEVHLAPELPRSIRRLRVEDIELGACRLTVSVDDRGTEVEVSGPLAVIQSPRQPLSDCLDR